MTLSICFKQMKKIFTPSMDADARLFDERKTVKRFYIISINKGKIVRSPISGIVRSSPTRCRTLNKNIDLNLYFHPKNKEKGKIWMMDPELDVLK